MNYFWVEYRRTPSGWSRPLTIVQDGEYRTVTVEYPADIFPPKDYDDLVKISQIHAAAGAPS